MRLKTHVETVMVEGGAAVGVKLRGGGVGVSSTRCRLVIRTMFMHHFMVIDTK